MAEFVKVAAVSEMEPGKVRQIKVHERTLALCNVSGTFYALDNFCIHRGGPLSEGWLDGETLECPWHAWRFDVKTGCLALDQGMAVETYDVKIEGGDIFVAI